MSLCKKFGKDKLIFVTREDLSQPSSIKLKELDERFEPRGLLLPDGTINWSCPCLGGMASGPCGFYFRQAFSCFRDSKEELKGFDCKGKFTRLQECMVKYPNLYPQSSEKDPTDAGLMKQDSPTNADMIAAPPANAVDTST